MKIAVALMAMTVSAAAQTQDNLRIIDKPIRFDEERTRLTREYMHKHYGIDSEDISIRPQVIVLHHTVTRTFESTWNYFNNDRIESARPELARESELNVSSQFVVDRDGTIYRLMPETWMARHCIGLNHVAIGIENVGDATDNPLTQEQVDSNAALVRYLAAKYPIVYMIGHSEYRRMEKTPLFKELVSGYRTGKDDPSDDFLRRVRAKISDLNLKTPPAK